MNTTPKPLDLATLPPEGTLMRTVMLMLALADLAEQAAGVSRAIRSYVLWVLRPVEALAWDYAFGREEQDFDDLTDYDLMAMRIGGSDPKDALDLAASFREIAAALQQVMIQCRLLGSLLGDGRQAEAPAFSRNIVGQPYSYAAPPLPCPALLGLSAQCRLHLASATFAHQSLSVWRAAPLIPDTS